MIKINYDHVAQTVIAALKVQLKLPEIDMRTIDWTAIHTAITKEINFQIQEQNDR